MFDTSGKIREAGGRKEMHPVRTLSLEGPWWDLRIYLAPEHIQEHTLETACPEWVYTKVLRELQIEISASHTALKKRGHFPS